MTDEEIARRIALLRDNARRARRWIKGAADEELSKRLSARAMELDAEADALEASRLPAGARVEHVQVQLQQQQLTDEASLLANDDDNADKE
ncbi:hypothetical protein [Reyranella sp.]|uniref:hypothetical protein n=1 Tax=Reyranella sp. TaxID=1929291 RepID=UPI001222B3C6|nr:hypothetical protein [Reyranella sp.]TAJ85394.1 MAG: hypothetical protein EPO50_16605 [Reyranella sp.]